MADQKISQFTEVTSLLASDYLAVERGGASNKRIRYDKLLSGPAIVGALGYTPLRSFNSRTAADVILQSSDLNGLSGAGLTGIGTGTGGVINTGSTTIGADSDADSVGVIDLQTRGLTRFRVENGGRLTLLHASGAGGFDVMRMNYNDPNSLGDFNFVQRLTANTYTPTNGAHAGKRDNVTLFGYNVSPTGKQVGGEHAFYTSLESRYITSEGTTQLEYYVEYVNHDNSFSSRPWSMTVNLDNDHAEIEHVAGVVRFVPPNSDGNPWLSFNGHDGDRGGEMNFYGASSIVLDGASAQEWLTKAGQKILKIVSGDDISVGDGVVGADEHLRLFPALGMFGTDALITLHFGNEGFGIRYNGAAGSGNSGFQYRETRNSVSNDWRYFNDGRLFDSGAYHAILIGADGSGPGGSGKALYIA
jgi:hypothetical protein